MSFGTGDISKHLISGLIPSTTSPLISGVIAASSAVDAGLISEFTYTVGSNSPDGKNTFRGYSQGSSVNYGSVTESSFDIADGTTITTNTTSGNFVNTNGFAIYEYVPSSGGQTFTIRFLILGQTSTPTFNDANWFTTLRMINNTDSTTEDIARSSFSDGADTTDGTNVFTVKTTARTSTTSTGDSVTIQLRSD